MFQSETTFTESAQVYVDYFGPLNAIRRHSELDRADWSPIRWLKKF